MYASRYSKRGLWQYGTLSRFGHSSKRDPKIAMEVIKPSSFRSSILSKLNIGGRTKITMLPFVEIDLYIQATSSDKQFFNHFAVM